VEGTSRSLRYCDAGTMKPPSRDGFWPILRACPLSLFSQIILGPFATSWFCQEHSRKLVKIGISYYLSQKQFAFFIEVRSSYVRFAVVANIEDLQSQLDLSYQEARQPRDSPSYIYQNKLFSPSQLTLRTLACHCQVLLSPITLLEGAEAKLAKKRKSFCQYAVSRLKTFS
jgi:hypothetical protein